MRRRTVLVLVAGRAAFRLAQYGAGIALLAIWGASTFSRYAAAVGLAGWLFALTAAGVERAALITVGRPGGRERELMFVAMGAVPFAVAAVACVVTLAATHDTALDATATAAAVAAGGGLATVLAALCRLRGRPYLDAAAFVVVSGAYVAVVLLAWLAGLGVSGLLLVLAVAITCVDLGLFAALWPGMARVRPRARQVREALYTATTLAAGEVLTLVAMAVLYAELTVAPRGQTSAFFLCSIVGSILIGIWPYLLRLAQPRISSWVDERPEQARATIRRAVLSVTVPSAALTTLGVVLVLVLGSSPALIIVTFAIELLVMVAVATVAFVVEAIDRRTRTASALGALFGVLVIAAAGALLIPSGGAAGALVALCVGWTVRCPFLLVAAKVTSSRDVVADAVSPAAPVPR